MDSLYENAPCLCSTPRNSRTSGCAGIISSPSTGEGGVGVIFIFVVPHPGMTVRVKRCHLFF